MTEENTNLEIPKKYNPETEEQKVIDFWQNEDINTFKFQEGKEIYSIDTPPPTVSGNMHIGHAFSYSQEDFVARYKKLAGFNVFYPFGTDDNGLPTERLVEKKKKVKSTKMDRTEFRDLCYNTIIELKEDFIWDWKRIGMSCDFTKSYSTISKDSQKISQKAFIDLHKKGLVYEQEAPMSWCPTCQTAIAQAEFESKNQDSFFNDIIFKSSEGDDLVIATTRPEFIPACVGLFAHPEDDRYSHLKGKTAKVPLFDYDVPIIYDEAVEKDKGTGLMMVCTFGDKEDIDKWKRHNLDLRIILEKYGKLNSLAGKYEGMTIIDARKAIIEDLKEAKVLIKQEKITHAVNLHDKCGTEIEFLKTKQWFIKILNQKEKLLAEVENITWHPSFMKKRMVNWIENLGWDWCISRQRHFGIPFPVWRHKTTGEIIFPEESQLPVDPSTHVPNGYKKEDLEPELDVMDTWATSSISPQIALASYGLDKQNVTVPMSLRPQAHDIIRTWAFYTLIRSVYQEDQIPWKEIAISGFVLASKGEKMSKSKGNVISPREILNKYQSADVLRFWAAGSKLGEDLAYKEQDLEAGKRFVTKAWNSFKFLSYFLSQEEHKGFDPNNKPELTTVDSWFLKKLSTIIEKNTKDFDNYEYDKVKYRTEQFFWQDFCDNFIEIVKDRLYKPEIYGKEAQASGFYTFYHGLKSLMVMMHPFTPFITESIWQYFFKEYESESSISSAEWPKIFEVTKDEQVHLAGQLAADIASVVRKFKSENKKPLNAEIEIKMVCSETIQKQIELVKSDILGTVKAKSLDIIARDQIRGDITLGEEESDEKDLEANEEATPKYIEFISFDIDFVENKE